MSSSAAAAVPFVDLTSSTAAVRDEIMADFAEVLDSGAFVNGPQVAAFEAEFAAWCGVDHCVGAASGLDALRLGLLAAGVSPGDEVIVPALTFIATFEAVTQIGARPVVVDVGEADYGLDVEAAEAAVTARTVAVVPVHLYGQMTDMRALSAAARARGLLVLEDACQAHGAERAGLRAGAGGDMAAFSFYPAKNLGAFGDAGALVTGSGEIADRVRALRQHGEVSKYRSRWPGYTARLDTLQAIALRRKLPYLDGWNRDRARAAAHYTRALEGVGDLTLPPIAEKSSPVWHLYVVRTADPLALASFLADHGIGSARHYPELPHLSEAYAELGLRPGTFPVAESVARECLSLPLFPEIGEQQLERVCGAVAEFFARG